MAVLRMLLLISSVTCVYSRSSSFYAHVMKRSVCARPCESLCINNECIIRENWEQCENDGHCPGAQRCIKNTCQLPDNSNCDDDTHCLNGFICVQGTCEAKLGDKCNSKDDCFVPNHDCIQNTCKVRSPGECIDDTHCNPSEICVQGICVQNDATKCASNAHCTNPIHGTVCVNGDCKPNVEFCNKDSPCLEGVLCIENQCVPRLEGIKCLDAAMHCPTICAGPRCELKDGSNCFTNEDCPASAPTCGLLDNQCIDAPSTNCNQGGCQTGEICYDNDCVALVGNHCEIKDHCSDGKNCVDNSCVALDLLGGDCLSNNDCLNDSDPETLYCNTEDATCVECLNDAHCFGAQTCIDNDCFP